MSQIQPETDHAYAKRMAGKRLLGGLLMAGGAMVALLCGACTAVFVLPALTAHGNLDPSLLVVSLLVGGVPAVCGVVAFVAGLSVFRDGLKRRGNPERVSSDGGGSE